MLLTGVGFEPPAEQPVWGELPRPEPRRREHRTPARRDPVLPGPAGRREHRVRAALADAIDAAGGVGLPIFATSLRDAPADLLDHLGTLDALITTVLAAGGTRPATASAGGEDEGWDVRALAALDIPILQGLCLTCDRAWWAGSDEGMSPLDVATQVAVPGVRRSDHHRAVLLQGARRRRTAALRGRSGALPPGRRDRRQPRPAAAPPPAERKIAIVLSAYPTKHSRIGNAVGLDTPVSLIRLLRAMREQGYDLGEPGEIPGTGELPEVEGEHPDTTAGNALIHALIDAGGQDPEWLTRSSCPGSRCGSRQRPTGAGWPTCPTTWSPR